LIIKRSYFQVHHFNVKVIWRL